MSCRDACAPSLPQTLRVRLSRISSGLRDAFLQLHRQQELEEPCGGEEPVKGCRDNGIARKLVMQRSSKSCFRIDG